MVRRHRTQDEEADQSVMRQKPQALKRIEREEDSRLPRNVHQAEDRQGQKPDEADRTEQRGDGGGATRLHQKQRHQNGQADPDHRPFRHPAGQGGNRSKSLHGRQYGHRRGDHGVAIEQARAANPEREDREGAFAGRALRQRHQRQHSALAAVVGPHQEYGVFDGDHDGERPEHQRNDPEDIRLADRATRRLADGHLERVQRAGPDVAEHHAQCADGQAAKKFRRRLPAAARRVRPILRRAWGRRRGLRRRDLLSRDRLGQLANS